VNYNNLKLVESYRHFGAFDLLQLIDIAINLLNQGHNEDSIVKLAIKEKSHTLSNYELNILWEEALNSLNFLNITTKEAAITIAQDLSESILNNTFKLDDYNIPIHKVVYSTIGYDSKTVIDTLQQFALIFDGEMFDSTELESKKKDNFIQEIMPYLKKEAARIISKY
jgi:hypothetical protein